MAETTKIEWTDATWNPITGCELKSPGCIHCYAAQLACTRLRNHPSRVGLAERASNGNYVFTGEVRFNEQWLEQPLQWTRPRMIFVVAHGDLFFENVPDAWIDRVFAVMALAPWHTYQLLTKRADRMAEYMAQLYGGRMYEITEKFARSSSDAELMMNSFSHSMTQCWMGVSAERQREFDERVPHLLSIDAVVKWISAEPLLGAIDMSQALDRLSWVVAGGESGSKARPMHPNWARSIRDQCMAANVPFHFKQWGSWLPELGTGRHGSCPDLSKHHNFGDGWGAYNVGKKAAGRLLDGREYNDSPRID